MKENTEVVKKMMSSLMEFRKSTMEKVILELHLKRKAQFTQEEEDKKRETEKQSIIGGFN